MMSLDCAKYQRGGHISRAVHVGGLLAILLIGCTPEAEQPSLGGWQGGEEHLRIVGNIEGELIDIGDDTAVEIIDFSCQREYVVPLVDGVPDETQAQFVELKLFATVEDAGETRYLTVEFKQHDMQSDALGSVVEVVPRLDTVTPGPTEMWVEWEWNADLGGDELLETAAQDGEFTVEVFSGAPPAGGVIIPSGEGQAGGYLDARWSQTDELKVSFTATCRENKITAQA